MVDLINLLKIGLLIICMHFNIFLTDCSFVNKECDLLNFVSLDLYTIDLNKIIDKFSNLKFFVLNADQPIARRKKKRNE